MDIPQMSVAHYAVDVGWLYLGSHMKRLGEMFEMEMDPPFQRGYVWTVKQQSAYLEYRLKGGISGGDVFFNCAGWNSGATSTIQIVDGKQRLKAVMDFMNNRVKVFACLFKDFEDRMNSIHPSFRIHVNDLKDPLAVVQWYLDMNTGGAVHTKKDLKSAYEYMEKLKLEMGQ